MIDEFAKHEDGAADAALIDLVGSAFDEGRRGRDAHDVLARGRRLRRRKRAVPVLGALGIVAASVSLAVAQTGPGGTAADTAGAGSGHSLTAGGTAVNVDNAAFSVHTDVQTGKITVTIRQFIDENELKQALAKAGVRTVFATTSMPQPALASSALSCTWVGATPLSKLADVIGRPTPGAPDTVVIDPSRMPSGSVLAFDYIVSADSGAVGVSTALLSGEPTGCVVQPVTK